MSRLAVLLAATVLPFASPAVAQGTDGDVDETAPSEEPQAEPVTADTIIDDSEPVVGPPLPPECEPDPLQNRVVICAPRDNAKFRIQDGPDWRTVDMKGDTPRAPDTFGIPNHGMVVGRGCFIPPCPPEQPIIIDLDAIPEAPPGSDADRVARGLAPRGYDGGSGIPDPEPIEDTPPPDE